MSKTLVIRVQSRSGRHVINSLYPDSTLTELQNVLQEKTTCPPSRQKILMGYPPREIDSYNPNCTLHSLRICSGDSLIMEELPPDKIRTEGGHCIKVKGSGSTTSPLSPDSGLSKLSPSSASYSKPVSNNSQPKFSMLPGHFQSDHRSSGTKKKGIFTLASFGDSEGDNSMHELGKIKTSRIVGETEITRELDPTKVTDFFWVWARPPHLPDNVSTHGKWLVFKPMATIDEAWHAIRRAVEAGEFGAGCTGAKCSTNREHPEKPKSTQGVYMVYTTEEGMDEVGMILAHKVRQTIRYKKDEDTYAGRYAHKGDKKITCKTIFWNDGEPSFEKLKR